jgi:hypothetical protein
MRRQLLAAGLVLATVLAVPVRALPAASPGLAAANPALQGPAAVTNEFLPLVTLGPRSDLAINRVEVIQGITMGDSYTVQVAGRPALLRVFISLTGSSSLNGISARVRRLVGGVEQNQMTVGPQTVYAATSEANLAHTYNFSLPAGWLTANSSYVVEVDSGNVVGETNEANNRYPAVGAQPFGAQSLPALNVVIVPVSYKGILPPTADLNYLTWMPYKVYPAPQINYSVHAPYSYYGDLSAPNGAGWSTLLGEIHSLHASEAPASTVYFALVDSILADGCAGGCIAGIGYIGWRSSVGFAGWPGARNEASPTFTHEMGHNFGRRHAPCGGPSGVDGSYPYANALIGQWGYDLATGLLKSPAQYWDYMSYCGDQFSNWTSDYTYQRIAQNWGAVADSASQAAAGAETSLIISGSIGPDGMVEVEPAFRGPASPTASPSGTSRVELIDRNGTVLAVVPFSLTEAILDGPPGDLQAYAFRVPVPEVPGLAGLRIYRDDQLIVERRTAGAAPAFASTPVVLSVQAGGGTQVAWQARAGGAATHYRVRYSPDGGATWSVLALDTASAQIDVPASLLAGASQPVLEIQASDGVRVAAQTIDIALSSAPH